MFIHIPRVNGKYAFAIGDDPRDNPSSFFWSFQDAHLLQGLPAYYGSFGEAHAFAQRVLQQFPTTVQAKKLSWLKHAQEDDAEAAAVLHFEDQADLLDKRLRSILSQDEKTRDKELGAFQTEVESLSQSGSDLMEKLESKDNQERLDHVLLRMWRLKSEAGNNMKRQPQPPPNLPQRPQEAQQPVMPGQPAMGNMVTASAKEIDVKDIRLPVLRAFSEAAMLSLSAQHPELYVKSIHHDAETDRYECVLSEPSSDVCRLGFNSDLLLNHVTPMGVTATVHPYHSRSFWERYWEPVTYGVGHFLDADHNVVMLPRHPKSKRQCMVGFSTARLSPVNVRIKLSRQETDGITRSAATWTILPETTISKVGQASPESLQNAEVRCIKRDLPTYYQRTGKVMSVVPREGYRDITVDFRRGLGALVLKDTDIELVFPTNS